MANRQTSTIDAVPHWSLANEENACHVRAGMCCWKAAIAQHAASSSGYPGMTGPIMCESWTGNRKNTIIMAIARRPASVSVKYHLGEMANTLQGENATRKAKES